MISAKTARKKMRDKKEVKNFDDTAALIEKAARKGQEFVVINKILTPQQIKKVESLGYLFFQGEKQDFIIWGSDGIKSLLPKSLRKV